MSIHTRNATTNLDHLFTGDEALSVKFDEKGNPHIFRSGKELHQSTCGGSKEKGRYMCVNIQGHNYLVHRVVGWWLVHKEARYKHLLNENWETHHIDRNPQNNSKFNLKVMTRSEHASLHSKENAEQRKFKKLLERIETLRKSVCEIKDELAEAKRRRTNNV